MTRSSGLGCLPVELLTVALAVVVLAQTGIIIWLARAGVDIVDTEATEAALAIARQAIEANRAASETYARASVDLVDKLVTPPTPQPLGPAQTEPAPTWTPEDLDAGYEIVDHIPDPSDDVLPDDMLDDYQRGLGTFTPVDGPVASGQVFNGPLEDA